MRYTRSVTVGSLPVSDLGENVQPKSLLLQLDGRSVIVRWRGRSHRNRRSYIDAVPMVIGRLILHVPNGERRSRAQNQRQGSLTGETGFSPHPRLNRPDDISPQSAVSVWNGICHGWLQGSDAVISWFWGRCERFRGGKKTS